jgi:2,4-dichlorophenol 6-monooxygenase
MGLVRMIRRWNEWLVVWGYDISQPAPKVDEAFAVKVVRDLVGDPDLPIQLQSVSTWTVNNRYATRMSHDRVFCIGDATHRHPPSNGLGSNTSIQDSFNLAWKLASVLKGQAGARLLESFDAERAPIARQIVTRANQSIDEFGPIFKALGLLDSIDPVTMQRDMDARCDDTPEAQVQRRLIREAIARKVYEFDAHGVDLNHRYRSGAIVTDGAAEPAYARDPQLHYQATSWPGARLPHVWLQAADGRRASTLDLAGKGRFTLFTGIGGDGWARAAAALNEQWQLELAVRIVGPRQAWQDLAGDWARASEVEDAGALLVRPDLHVAWRSQTRSDDPLAELRRVLGQILAR